MITYSETLNRVQQLREGIAAIAVWYYDVNGFDIEDIYLRVIGYHRSMRMSGFPYTVEYQKTDNLEEYKVVITSFFSFHPRELYMLRTICKFNIKSLSKFLN